MRSLFADLRTGGRALRTAPGSSFAAVLALSLGVATAVTLYTAFRTVADDLPPIPHPERVGRLYFADETTASGWRALRARDVAPLVEQAGDRLVAALVEDADVALEIDGCAAVASVRAQVVTPAFFAVAGVAPQRGRIWTADGLAERSPLLVGADLWRRACGAAPDIVGRPASVDGRPYEVAGVMPDGFWLTNRDAGLWLPLVHAAPDDTPMVVARLSGAGTWADVNGRFAAGPARDRGLAIALTDPRIRRGRLAFVGLLGPALLVLLVACGNAAGLLVGRALRRKRDLAVRLSLGATPGRLARQAFAETALVATVAGLAAVPLAAAGAWALRRGFALSSPALARGIAVDAHALAFALAIVAATAILTGVMPAAKAARADVTPLLSRGPARPIVRRGHYTPADLLVVLQVALAVVLLVVAAMFGRLFDVLAGSLPGRPDRTFVADVATPDRAAPTPDALRRLVAAMREVPGVAHVAVADSEPQPAEPGGPAIEALDAPPGAEGCRASVSAVGGEYFAAFSVPLRAGRFFTGWESPAAPRVAVVSETMARRCWGRADAVGRRLRFARFGDAPWLVIGVVNDVAGETRLRPKPAELYVPFAQAPRGETVLLVETRAVAGMAERLATASPSGAVRLKRWRRVGDEVSRARLVPGVLQALSAIALLLALLGVSASISQSLAREWRGLAIRLTLGAPPARLVAAGVGRQAVLALIGIFAGTVVTVAVTTQAWGQLLQAIGPDPRLWLAVGAPLAACGLLASLGPMVRIVRLDPIAALRRADE